MIFLNQVCRLGGERLPKMKSGDIVRPFYLANDFQEEINSTFKVDISCDNKEIHPPYICIKCHHAAVRGATQHKHTLSGGGCGNGQVTWEAHRRSSCDFCSKMALKKGGRPCKQKKTALSGNAASRQDPVPTQCTEQTAHPSTSQSSSCGMDIDGEIITNMSTPSYRAEKQLLINRFIDKSAVSEVKCSIYSNFPDKAIQSPCCDRLFCCVCISQYLSTHNTCPACHQPMKASCLQQPCKLFQQLSGKWSIRCDFYDTALRGCGTIVPLEQLQEHTKQCAFSPTSTTPPIRSVRGSSIVEDILSASPSKLQGNKAEELKGCLVHATMSDGMVEVRKSSRGKARLFMQTTKSAVSSDQASATTVRRRFSELKRMDELVSGSAEGARTQEIASLKRLSSKEQEELLRDAGLRSTTPASGSLLAIKADLSLPWNQVRKLKRWLRSFGVTLESEETARAFIATHVPQYTARNVPMTRQNGEIVMTALVHFPDLVAVIMHYLELYYSCGKLGQHHAIPEKEIWIKLGGDHGGGSFKFVFQVANVSNPNSLHNTIPVCVFEGPDNVSNLETAIGIYREHVVKLQETVWRGHKFVVFFFGDYELQTKSYGLSGSSGTRPCLHCLCQKKSMDTPPTERPPRDVTSRSLRALADDHSEFVAAGSIHANAKNFNNVLRPVILPVPVQNVVIPALHLDLGIFPWMFTAFEADVLTLDIALAERGTAAETDGRVFSELRSLHAKAREIKQSIEEQSVQLDTIQQQLQYTVLFGGDDPAMDTEAIASTLQVQYRTVHAKHASQVNHLQKVTDSISTMESSKQFVALVQPALSLFSRLTTFSDRPTTAALS